MDANLVEIQQVEQLKAFWFKYGKKLFIFFLALITAYYVWQYFEFQKEQHSAQASNIYGQMLNYSTLGMDEDATTQALALSEKYSKTPYAAFANLYLAKNAVQDDDLETAKTHLHWVITHFPQAPFVQVAQLRLARIEMSGNELAAATTRLENFDEDGYTALSQLLKAHAATEQGDKTKAIALYQQAYQVKEDGAMASLRPYIAAKLNDLGESPHTELEG